ncbi:hypothetical protein FA95DRAFT_1214201 [Auriscalpium vulgare]|uniref:Uncharacterized protein n=1 Tax=Auriscalpium vulgare TaxID=40419 RepID=A0ACB8RTM6_9AGAM|nr:hypothetical protein FA95DRAFT_1214201 [Auriscalpium vulgare]
MGGPRRASPSRRCFFERAVSPGRDKRHTGSLRPALAGTAERTFASDHHNDPTCSPATTATAPTRSRWTWCRRGGAVPARHHDRVPITSRSYCTPSAPSETSSFRCDRSIIAKNVSPEPALGD